MRSTFIEGKMWYGKLPLFPTQLCSSNLCARAPLACSTNANGQQMPHWQHQHTLSRLLGSTLDLPCENFNRIQLFKIEYLSKITRDINTPTLIYFRILFGQRREYNFKKKNGLNDRATTWRVQEVLVHWTGLQVSSCWRRWTCIWQVSVHWELGWLCSASVLHLTGEGLQGTKALMATCLLNIPPAAVT